jgi:hypothetical protein
MYYRGAAAAIVVYDITNPDSFIGAKSWVKELQRRGDPNVVIALVSLNGCLISVSLPSPQIHPLTVIYLQYFRNSRSPRLETKQTWNLGEKLSLKKLTLTLLRMEFCIWKHLPR